MTDNTKKTSDLTVANTVLATDRFVMVANTSGIPKTVTVEITDVYKENPIQTPYLVIGNGNNALQTPNSSSQIISKGTFWFDSNYFYIAVADNSIKRIALENF